MQKKRVNRTTILSQVGCNRWKGRQLRKRLKRREKRTELTLGRRGRMRRGILTRRLLMMNLLAMAVFILALPSVTHEGPTESSAALWPFRVRDSQPEPSAVRGPICISEAIYRISREHGIPPKLVQAIIQVESQGNLKATSRKGALGLMQLMPEVLEAYQVADPFDPVANLRAGVKHLDYLLLEFSGNLSLALAAYNAGPGTVRKYRGIPPYPETREFLRNVLREYQSQGNEPALPWQTLRVKKVESVEKIPTKISLIGNPRDLTAFLQRTRISYPEVGFQ